MKCPGQDSRYWKPESIFEAQCPECGAQVEFFKDDSMRRCKKCGHRFLNPGMDFGCASYCKYAEECIGNLPPELIAQKEDLLKDRVAIEMKRYFKKDFKRIGHASRVARYAEKIGKKEGADLAVVLTAAYLHDIGLAGSDRALDGEGARTHEETGQTVAREILERLGAREELIEEVVGIIGRHHHSSPDESINFKSVHDADLIVNTEEGLKKSPAEACNMAALIENSFLTKAGRILAETMFLSGK